MSVLSEDENWKLLGSVALGRLVTNFAGEPEIFPVTGRHFRFGPEPDPHEPVA